MNFDELVGRLPRSSTSPPLVGTHEGVTYVGATNPSFVAPELSDTDHQFDSDRTSAILLSAPAAVGKSTVAKELAFRTSAALWNLAAFQVGSGTTVGTLADAFGIGALGDVMNRLASGKFLIVMDALDEANLRAGERNFEAFIQDLVKLCKGDHNRPAVVLLARAETAELVALHFEESSVQFAQYQIDFFRQQAAEEFVDKRLDAEYARLGRAPAHRVHYGPYVAARDQIFRRVFGLLGVRDEAAWDSPLVQSFLGYAPVLEAIAAYISLYENYAQMASVLDSFTASTTGGSDLWNFLVQIVESVMDREQGKIQPQVKERLASRADELRWNQWGELYGGDEQCSRVLDSILHLEISEPLPTSLPAQLRTDYEEALRTSVLEHPFRGPLHGGFANVVFRDYLFAWSLVRGTPTEREGVRTRMVQPDSLSTPLLARFLLLFSSTVGSLPRITGMTFPFFYESIRSQTRINGEIHLSLDQNRETQVVTGVVATGQKGDTDTQFEVLTEGSPIRFLRVLDNAVISLADDVIFGWDTETFVLGPDVDIECGVLQTAASAIRVQTGKATSKGDETGDVLVVANRVVHSGVAPQLALVGHGSLRVRGSVVHPWFRYVDKELREQPVTPELLDISRFFFRILVKFRGTTAYEGLCRGRHTIDTGAVAGSREALNLLNFLLDRGFLEVDGILYCLRLDRMSRAGINWADVRARVLTPGVIALLTDFLSINES